MVDEGEARQLANETLDEQFTEHYKGGNEFSLAVQDLIQIHGGGRDEQIRKLVLRLHHHSQARPDAAGWLARQRMQFSSAEPVEWERWLRQAIENWRDEWLPVLQELKPENEKKPPSWQAILPSRMQALARLCCRLKRLAGSLLVEQLSLSPT